MDQKYNSEFIEGKTSLSLQKLAKMVDADTIEVKPYANEKGKFCFLLADGCPIGQASGKIRETVKKVGENEYTVDLPKHPVVSALQPNDGGDVFYILHEQSGGDNVITLYDRNARPAPVKSQTIYGE